MPSFFQHRNNMTGKITIITPPDKLFNAIPGYLFVSPSTNVKLQVQEILAHCGDDLTIFMYEKEETNIDWLLSVAHTTELVVIDVDNCSPLTKSFISFLLVMPHVHYITSDEITPYHLLSRNRIYDLDWMVYREDEEDEMDD